MTIDRKKPPESAGDQSARYIEAAKKAGVDESGRKFARVIEKIVKAKPRSNGAKRK